MTVEVDLTIPEWGDPWDGSRAGLQRPGSAASHPSGPGRPSLAQAWHPSPDRGVRGSWRVPRLT